MLLWRDADRAALASLLDGYRLAVREVAADADIPGSYWGEAEAGLIGDVLYLRPDTPVHSLLHEACHYICMTPQRRAALHTDAGGDDPEEAAVCYLQVTLADRLPGVGAGRLLRDMDDWGYSFRLGSSRDWFRYDADDARDWLRAHALIDTQGAPTGRLRR